MRTTVQMEPIVQIAKWSPSSFVSSVHCPVIYSLFPGTSPYNVAVPSPEVPITPFMHG
jgi:hypothetical protein